MGTDTLNLAWIINNTNTGRYAINENGFPQLLTLYPPLPDVTIMITSASLSGMRIESTLNADVSTLRETLIECSPNLISRNTTVQELQGIRCSKNVQNKDLLP